MTFPHPCPGLTYDNRFFWDGVIRAAAQGASRDHHMMISYYRDDIGDLPEMADVALVQIDRHDE